MKRLFISFIFACAMNFSVSAQSNIKFGYVNVDSLLKTLPDYQRIEQQIEQLKGKYKAEADYNEQTFRRQYAEFLQGQKQFTPNIMAKRQADLQQSLEKNMAFRQQADSLLSSTQKQLLAPIQQRMAHAIRIVGLEHGYEYILDTSLHTVPFIHPQVGEDVTSFVLERYNKIK